MTHRVTILTRAERQVAEIAEWIARHSSDGAVRWLDAFEAAADSLRQDPERCPLAPESEHVDREIRQILFHTRRGAIYRALFTVEGDEVRILHVRGPGQALVPETEL